MPNLQIGAPSLHGFLQQPLVKPRSPTPGDTPVTSWAPNSTLTQYHPNSRRNGCADGSNGTVFFRPHQDCDNSMTPRHHIVVPGLNFAEISCGRGTNHKVSIHQRYGDETEDKGVDNEALVLVDAGNHLPLTPPSGYGSASVVMPTPRDGCLRSSTMLHQVFKRLISPAQSSDSQSDTGDDDPNKSTFFPSINVAPAQWVSKICLPSSCPPQILPRS